MTGPHIPEPLGKWGPSSKCWQDPDVDTEWFFPRSYGTPRTPSEHVQEVKAYCHDCPVRNTCLEHAIDTYDDHGMWGGLTPDERRELRKAMRQGRKPQSTVITTKQPVKQPRAIKQSLEPCGTEAAYRRHKRRDEPIDDACRHAHNAKRASERKASA